MFITVVCVLFLIKLRWPKNKSIYVRRILVRNRLFFENSFPEFMTIYMQPRSQGLFPGLGVGKAREKKSNRLVNDERKKKLKLLI